MEQNELNVNAMGGTELLMYRLETHVSSDLLDKVQIIPSRARIIDPEKPTILYVHDLADDPEAFQALGEGRWKRFDKIVFVSHWQQSMYERVLGVPYNAGVVIHNGIVPIEEHTKPRDKIRMMYFSTPHRGLDILYNAFCVVENMNPTLDLELNVFSSFGLYGWLERDAPFVPLFNVIRAHPKMNYSGAVSNDVIRDEIKRSHIFAYPSTWPETSCLCLIEAMSGGLQCVHSSLAALPETSLGLTSMYDFTDIPRDHVSRMAVNLNAAVQTEAADTFSGSRDSQVRATSAQYNYASKAKEWERLISQLTS